MAQRVVECLEVIHINEQQRVLMAVTESAHHCLFEPVHQQPAVGQASQRVREGQSLNLVFGPLAVGDVGADTAVTLECTRDIKYRFTAQDQITLWAACEDAPYLELAERLSRLCNGFESPQLVLIPDRSEE